MRKYLLAAALAVLAGSSALAATHHTRAVRNDPAKSAYDYVTPSSDIVGSTGVLGAGANPVTQSRQLEDNQANFGD